MSSANRGAKRQEADFYGTPAWCTHSAVQNITLPGGTWLEPCAGNGAIIRAVKGIREDIHWTAFELREECRELLIPEAPVVDIGDFLKMPMGIHYDVILTNPPYSIAQEFVEEALRRADHVVMLLRLNFLGSKKRSAFFRKNAPDVYVLPKRPSFINGRTDSTEYAWFHWQSGVERTSGKLEVLPLPQKLVL